MRFLKITVGSDLPYRLELAIDWDLFYSVRGKDKSIIVRSTNILKSDQKSELRIFSETINLKIDQTESYITDLVFGDESGIAVHEAGLNIQYLEYKIGSVTRNGFISEHEEISLFF